MAIMAHASDYRRDGVTPYIRHVEAVVARLDGAPKLVLAAAWLHDVVEDHPEVAETGQFRVLPDAVTQAVDKLTHRPGEPYVLYISRLRSGGSAVRRIKIADIMVNLSDTPTRKQILRYSDALQALLEDDLTWPAWKL